MAGNLLSDRADYGRTFNSVMWVVGTLAATLFFAAALEMLRRPAGSDRVASTASGAVPQNGSEFGPAGTEAGPAFPDPAAVFAGNGGGGISGPESVNGTAGGNAGGNPAETPHLASGLKPLLPGNIGGNAGGGFPNAGAANRSLSQPSILPEPSFTGPQTNDRSLSESLNAAQLTVEKIDDPVLERLMAAGEELRAGGNLMGALDAFKQVESALPDHPRVLGELAATYNQLGREADALVHWARIVDLGPVRSGGYYKIANGVLEGDQVPIAGSTVQQMKIGEVIVKQAEPDDQGQKVSLRVIVDANPASSPSGSDLALAVYFYDIVDGQTIEASTADTSKLYPTEPYDWAVDGTEEIVVNYHQPVFSEEQARELGERRYYGYAIELYYRDQLQDKVTMPEEIAALRIQETPEQEESAPVFLGPDNALFPDPLTP